MHSPAVPLASPGFLRARAAVTLALLLLLAAAAPARAQIRSYTVGLDVNCPYGLTECWALMREGLEAIDTVAAVSPRPDAVRGTFEMRAKDPGLVNPQLLATNIFLMGVGARLRGLELTADGTLEKHNSQFLLRIDGVKVPLRLAALREKIQMNNPKKRREEISELERTAYQTLVAQASNAAPRVRITGPLAKPTATAEAVLEVRTFEFVTARP
ncbi:hypothetical protein LBMAG56_51050 [Verrucomicrobiota bacterium]|nr:hypothetical protein LBMAG56_51050 [Verrucomicrobiota bacterium]